MKQTARTEERDIVRRMAYPLRRFFFVIIF